MTAFRITQYDTEAIITWNGQTLGVVVPAGDSDTYNFRILIAALASGLQASLIHQFTATHADRNRKPGRLGRGKTQPQQPSGNSHGRRSRSSSGRTSGAGRPAR